MKHEITQAKDNKHRYIMVYFERGMQLCTLVGAGQWLMHVHSVWST